MNREQFPVETILEGFLHDEEFKDYYETDAPAYAVYNFVQMSINEKDKLRTNHFPSNTKFKVLDICSNKEMRDEEGITYTVLFKRVSDDKNFIIWVHDNISIGPDSLTLGKEATEYFKDKL